MPHKQGHLYRPADLSYLLGELKRTSTQRDSAQKPEFWKVIRWYLRYRRARG